MEIIEQSSVEFNIKAFLQDETCAECGREARYYCNFCESFLCARCVKQHIEDKALVIKIGE